MGAHEVTESRVFLCDVRGPGGEQGRRGGIGGREGSEERSCSWPVASCLEAAGEASVE